MKYANIFFVLYILNVSDGLFQMEINTFKFLIESKNMSHSKDFFQSFVPDFVGFKKGIPIIVLYFFVKKITFRDFIS